MKRYLLVLSFIAYISSHLSATILYVNANAQGGNNDGSSWPNAYLNLQDALTAADYGDTLWVAMGTYLPTATANRNFSFNLKNGVRMFGGFSGSETQLNQRDLNISLTILSGDIGAQGDSTDNSFTVVFASFVDSTTILDGFVVTGGNANSTVLAEPASGRTKSGGGMYLISASATEDSRPSILNCKFMANHANNYGGGIYMRSNSSGSVTPLIAYCAFTNNTAQDGGGIFKQGSSIRLEMKIDSCVFLGNFAYSGGAFNHNNNYGSLGLSFSHCNFEHNSNLDLGGGIYQENNGQTIDLKISKCSFIENFDLGSGTGSAILILTNVGLSIANIDSCSFLLNTTTGDAPVGTYYSDLNLFRCRFIANVGTDGNGCLNFQSGKINVVSCEFLHNSANLASVALISSNAEVLCLNSTVSNNESFGMVSDYEGVFVKQGNAFNFSLNNSIILNNSSGNLKIISGKATISHTLIDAPDCASISSTPITCGPGMIYLEDPLFLDTSAGDYRLHPCSPARNTGSNQIVDSLNIQTDIEGAPRIQGGTVDMGAYESPRFGIASASVGQPPCTGTTGTLTMDLEYGCPPFFFAWPGGSAIADTPFVILQVPLGTYSVTVTDGKMEGDTIAVQIVEPQPLAASLSATPVICPQGAGVSVGGTATISAAGGTGAFSYLWSNSDITATAANLPAGTATVTATDANGCTLTDSVSIGAEGSLQLGLNIGIISCHDSSDGTATVTPLGGTMPFEWLWLSNDTTPMIDSLSGGSYSATVTDVLGCTGDLSFMMEAPTEVVASIEAVQPPCFGGLATATASATGGTPGYHFLWDNGAMPASTMLVPGFHTCTVTDEHGCPDTAGVSIIAPPLLVAGIAAQPPTLCFGGSNGMLAALPTGGTPPYGLLWSAGPTNLPAGNYLLTVTDANGCTASASATIAEHPEITATDTITNASSPTATDGGVTLTDVVGGTGSGYTFEWSNGTASQNLLDVPTGTYSLTVTDSQGCTAVFSFFVGFANAVGETVANPFGAAIVPNPSGRAGARLVLENAEPGMMLRVFDAQGRLVFAEQMTAAEHLLPKGLAAGAYQVLLENGKRSVVLTWVVGE
ncbi:MAG: hypothetical protein K9J37_10385 [Saprospiraceae bacterium]|nr:hypothetical protein [Saprospiraceae bacterium]MCF8250311.1 hypothetical protein [Saprospiraceae bacterium]MCF8312057.1 hypothetical protein [Saprospiraceae bacterium]MCF8440464.1 hypothetical protein [Saprospiraceae bacterium]